MPYLLVVAPLTKLDRKQELNVLRQVEFFCDWKIKMAALAFG